MSIPDETLARWAAWPRPGTRGLWCAHIDGDGSPGEVVCHDPDQPIFTAQVAQFVEPEDIAAIAALPEMREAIDVLVAEVRGWLVYFHDAEHEMQELRDEIKRLRSDA